MSKHLRETIRLQTQEMKSVKFHSPNSKVTNTRNEISEIPQIAVVVCWKL